MINREVAAHILEVITTMEQGLDYIEEKLAELHIEATLGVLVDTIDAFAAIEQAMNPLLPELGKNDIAEKTEALKDAFNVVVQEYEKGNNQNIIKLIQTSLSPKFNLWKNEIEANLTPYVMH